MHKFMIFIAAITFFSLCFFSGVMVGEGTLNYLQGALLFAFGMVGGMLSSFMFDDVMSMGM